jgi:hypothetical protein
MGIARNLARLVPNGSGLLPNANIEAVAASKLTGSVALATQVSGTLPDANAPSGSITQCIQFEDNTHRSWTGSGRSNIFVVPGPFGDGSVFITRSVNTSKILVDVRLMVGADNDTWSNFLMQYAPEGSGYSYFPNRGVTTGGITEAGTLAHFGTSSGGGSQSDTQYRLHPATYQYILDPSTTQNKVFIRIMSTYGHAASRTVYLNRPSNTGDNNRYVANSVITLKEIAI